MSDASELQIATRQITKELLEELKIREAICKKYAILPDQAKQAIDEYAKYFCQLWRVINAPHAQ